MLTQLGSTHRVVAVVEEGAWRVKDRQTGHYLVSKEAWDEFHEYGRWWPRDSISEHAWHTIAHWGIEDEDAGMFNGRSARMIAAFADGYLS